MKSDRFERWVHACFSTARMEQFLPVAIQGLGRLDVQLIENDERLLAEFGVEEPSEPSFALSDQFTLSYLWVLGAYEVVRTISQRLSESDDVSQELTDRFLHLKRDFTRLRVPLAKMEPASRHKATDSHIAYPSLHREKGISWHLADEYYVSRRDLSDALLEVLEYARDLDPNLP